MRRALLALLLSTIPALAQSPVVPTFDVASVRPSKPDASQHSNVPLDAGNVYSTISPDDARTSAGGLLIATHQPLWRYITFAYHLSGTQELALRFNYFSGLPKSGAPTWVTGTFNSGSDYFDIEARATPGTSIDQMRLMMQALLADRFHLAVHHATTDAPVFALVLAKSAITGPDLRPHPASDTCSKPQPDAASLNQPAVSPTAASSLPPICGVIAHVPSSTPGQHYGGRAVTLNLLATSLPTMTGMAVISRPVVDQTGLTGLYDFTLTWVHDSAGSDASVSDNITAFHEALKTQLGLQLKSTRAPIDILVVDHVEHPSAN